MDVFDRPVLAYHLIISAYGFWLPNDPRGSWSAIVRNPYLRAFGEATKVETRQSVAGRPHDRRLRYAAKRALTYPPVRFNGLQAKAIADGIGRYVEKSGVTVWACAVLPDHAHLVVARHRYDIESVANLMKGEATKQLRTAGRHPFERYRFADGTVPPCFGRKWWVVYAFDENHVRNAIRYTNDNPVESGLKSQARMWPFVVPYPKRRLG